MTTPTSELTLYSNIPLDPNYNFTMDFNSLEAQESYFSTKIANVLEEDTDYSYIRATEELKVQANKEDLNNVNYLSFKNKDKVYYAFILDKRYISDTCTGITFKIDVMQTFMADYELKESFIERQHEDRYDSNLKPIFNTKLENLESGSEYIKTNEISIKENSHRYGCYLIVASKNISKSTTLIPRNVGKPTSSLADPLQYYIIPYYDDPSSRVNLEDTDHKTMLIEEILSAMTSAYTDTEMQEQVLRYQKIISISILPYLPFDFTANENIITPTDTSKLEKETILKWDDLTMQKRSYYIYHLHNMSLRENLATFDLRNYLDLNTPTLNISNHKNINYEPKLSTHPYKYMTLDCDQIEPVIIKPQFISNLSSTKVKFLQSISLQPTTKYYIENYKGDNGNDTQLANNSINDITIASNKLNDYLAQNKASATSGIAVNRGLNIGQTILGLATKSSFGYVSAIQSGISIFKDIFNESIKRQDLSQSDYNINSKGNNIYYLLQQYNTDNGLKLRFYGISEEYKNSIFEFLYHYGYKCNNFITPNLRSRYYFNYIKTIGANIETNIDADYKNELVQIFDRGITIWHYRDSTTFKGVNNYDYENVEMNLIGD